MLNNCNSCKDCMFSFNIKACICFGHQKWKTILKNGLIIKLVSGFQDKRVKDSIKEELTNKSGSIETDNIILKRSSQND